MIVWIINKNDIVILKDNNIETIGFIPVSKEIADELDLATEAYYSGHLKKEEFVEKVMTAWKEARRMKRLKQIKDAKLIAKYSCEKRYRRK